MGDWYYLEGNESKGPISESELRGLLAAATITPGTLVWCEGLAEWTPAGQIAPRPRHLAL